MHIRPLVLTHKYKRTNCGIAIIFYTTAKMWHSYYGMSSLSSTSVDEMVFISYHVKKTDVINVDVMFEKR